MEELLITFGTAKTNFFFDGTIRELDALSDSKQMVILTDENLFQHYKNLLANFPVIVMPAGEHSKQLSEVEKICSQLIDLQTDRNALLIGFGGGVICDMAGFVAGIYKRGIQCAFIPTTVLAMVDAAVGGKNGVNVGGYKNMIGLFRQPKFILYDYSLLQTLPDEEWQNGFAEIIKHACIADKEMFEMLSCSVLDDFKKDKNRLAALVKRNVLLKTRFVQKDIFEQDERKKLNFGHTLAHGIERTLNLKHGYAVAIGMAFAASISEEKAGFTQKNSLVRLLNQYQLPSSVELPVEAVYPLLQADKKRSGNNIHFILLKAIGESVIYPLGLEELENNLRQWKQ